MTRAILLAKGWQTPFRKSASERRFNAPAMRRKSQCKSGLRDFGLARNKSTRSWHSLENIPGSKNSMTISSTQATPSLLKQSRTKIWIRTGILAVFGTLFGLTLYHDIETGSFQWLWAMIVLALFLPVGFWMRKWVPMQVHPASRHVTLSFDRIYFGLIVFLVIVKAIAGNILGVAMVADVAMCVILGLMIGRLSGVCLRVRDLKRDLIAQAV